MGKGLHVCHCVIVEVIGVCMWSESDSVVWCIRRENLILYLF